MNTDKIKRLTCPADDSSSTIEIASMTGPDLIRWIASQLKLPYNEGGDKAYLGRGQTKPAIPNPLPVKYFYQFDSATSHGDRMCFSSSCAMLAKFLKPNALTDNPNADDEYLNRVLKFGDTTDPNAQIKALSFLGISARYSQKVSWTDVDSQLKAGKPVPIGWLHKGKVSSPTGGGHWSVIIGRAGDTGYIVHDPAGEADLVNGVYVASKGSNLVYSKANLGPRWMVEGPGTGWAILA